MTKEFLFFAADINFLPSSEQRIERIKGNLVFFSLKLILSSLIDSSFDKNKDYSRDRG